MKLPTLSVRQPWAWLIVNGHKDIENRTRKTKVRGRILIHASKTIDKAADKAFREAGWPMPEQYELGGIVGETELYHVIADKDLAGRKPDSRWYEGPVGYCLRNSKPLKFQPCKGQLGFFDVNYEGDKDGDGKSE